MSTEDKVLVLSQAQPPSAWLEWVSYLCIFALFIGVQLAPTSVFPLVALTGLFMYWNYRLFRMIEKYVRYYNASEFSKLLHKMAMYDLNKQKDGTFQDTECLTKEQDDEESTLQSGD
jgi:hypothetical protein